MKRLVKIIIFIFLSHPVLFAQREKDSLALVALYNSTNGPNWTNKTNWLSTEPISKWFGVTVSNDRVYVLNLQNNNLSGSLTSEIGNLSSLGHLVLNGNKLSGSIPASIGGLLNLQYLGLYGNQLSGSIPTQIGNLVNLGVLYLSINNLSGQIPQEIGNLTNLASLSLHSNQLTGPIPTQIGNLSNLITIELGMNLLSGDIPKEIGNLSKLEKLALDWNRFTGSVPVDINNLIKLKTIFLNSNSISDFPIILIQSIEQLNLANNRLTFEDIEPNIGKPISAFSYIPQDSIGTRKDINLNSGQNFNIKAECGGLNNQYQWYKNNSPIPAANGSDFNISSLRFTDAGSYICKITNSKVPGLTIISRPVNLTVSENGRVIDSLALVALYNSTNGPNWKNKTNWLSSEPISKWYGVTVTDGRVKRLSFTLNNLTGPFPKEIGDLTALTFLKVDMNSITSIPPGIGNLKNLDTLFLFMDLIEGEIPSEIGNLSNLVSLDLGINKFHGTIPVEISKLNNLTHLGLGNNNLTGPIPEEIYTLSKLKSIDLQHNRLSGSITSSINNLSILDYLNLGFNDFKDISPLTFEKLRSLVINNNHLTFEDIEPNLNAAYQYINYSPQDSIGIKNDTLGLLGKNFTFKIVCGGVNNQYQWFKNNSAIPGASSSEYTISGLKLSDAGSYRCEITNTLVPGLTIFSRPVNLEIIDPYLLRQQDSLALVALYNSTNGPNWTNKTNWLSSEPISKWYGVNVANNRVVQLQLGNNNLSGILPSNLGNLSQLDILELSSNKLTGILTPEIGKLINLRILDLGKNQITGTILPEIFNMSSLFGLQLNGNQFTGPILPEIGNLTKLNYLDLSGNHLSGTIPSTIGNLIHLDTQLSLDDNELSGAVPVEINNLKTLLILGLSKNRFNEFPKLTSTWITELRMQSNRFTFEDIEPNINVPHVSFIYAPQDSIGIEKDTLALLGKITLKVFCGGTNNKYQWYKDNIAIPYANGKNYEILSSKLSDAGSYRCEITNTLVTGLTIYSRPINIQIVDPGFLRQQDSLALVALYNSTGGPAWTNKTNWLSSQPISTWYGVSLWDNRVSILYLPNNNLNGSIPPEIGNLTGLASLILMTNSKLTGTIPKEIGNLINLGNLNLEENNLTGTIPKEIGNLTNLRELLLNSNSLSGPVPAELWNLKKFMYLNLAFNKFTGKIPRAIGDFTELGELNLRDNQFTDTIPQEINNLKKLFFIDIGKNNFTSLPAMTLTILENLRIDYNRFTFKDIEPNIYLKTKYDFIYSPQKSFGIKKDTTRNVGENITFIVDCGGVNNEYQWYKNGRPFSGSTNGSLTLINLTLFDAGTYTCIVSNSVVPNLTIFSEPIVLTVQNKGQEQDSLALVAIYNSTGGPNWKIKSNWLSSNPISKWTGVTMTNNRVTGLSLSQNNLTGTLPKDIGNLTMLKELYLVENKISGIIPPELGNLTEIISIHLSNNLLSGDLPSEFNKLTKLRSIKLNNNILSGLPSLTLPALDTLYIQNNILTFEDIEPNFTIAKREFFYSPQDSTGINQRVSQRINKSYTFHLTCGGKNNAYQWYKENAKILQATDSIFVIPKIKQTDAGYYTCSVTNSVVSGLVINSRPIILEVTPDGRTADSLALVTLYKTSGGTTWTNNTNWLSSKPISSWYGVTVGSNEGSKGLADTTSVIRLNLSGNNLKGSIPKEIGKMTALQSLDLSNNYLDGSVPQEINSITSLQALDLSKNRLDNLPVLTLANLDTLLINNNQFSFNDIEPNLNNSDIGIKYFSQDSIGMKKDTLCFTGSSIKFSVPDSASHNYYIWLKDNVPLPNSASHIYKLANLELSDSGIYTCKITNSLVTGLTINSRPVKLRIAQGTGIQDVGNSLMKVYPNPSGGIIKVEFQDRLTNGARIELYNYYGIVLFNKVLDNDKYQEFDFTHLPAGIYFLKVYDRSRIYNQKIVLH